jgi:hypothetical protein
MINLGYKVKINGSLLILESNNVPTTSLPIHLHIITKEFHRPSAYSVVEKSLSPFIRLRNSTATLSFHDQKNAQIAVAVSDRIPQAKSINYSSTVSSND